MSVIFLSSFHKSNHLNSQQHYRYFADEETVPESISDLKRAIWVASGRAGILPQVALALQVVICFFIAQPLKKSGADLHFKLSIQGTYSNCVDLLQ